jgi:hypothetical protein
VVLLGEGDLVEITGGVKDSQDLDAGVGGSEVEAVFAEGITAAAWGELRPLASDRLPLGEVFELCPKAQNQTVSLEGAVSCNVIPNVSEISF